MLCGSRRSTSKMMFICLITKTLCNSILKHGVTSMYVIFGHPTFQLYLIFCTSDVLCYACLFRNLTLSFHKWDTTATTLTKHCSKSPPIFSCLLVCLHRKAILAPDSVKSPCNWEWDPVRARRYFVNYGGWSYIQEVSDSK